MVSSHRGEGFSLKSLFLRRHLETTEHLALEDVGIGLLRPLLLAEGQIFSFFLGARRSSMHHASFAAAFRREHAQGTEARPASVTVNV
jgi:hypothetical protein